LTIKFAPSEISKYNSSRQIYSPTFKIYPSLSDCQRSLLPAVPDVKNSPARALDI